MKKIVITLLAAMGVAGAFADEPFAAVKAIVGRLSGGYNGAEAAGADAEKATAAMAQFVFVQDSSIAAGAGKVEPSDGKIKISASDASGASFALGQYLRHTAKVHISWCGNRTIGKYEKYPLPTAATTYTPAVPVRFAYNYCTLSYTMAFWGAKEWREEIDRLALSGYNVALVLQGLQEAWRVTLESVIKADGDRVYSDEQIMKYVSDEAAQAWWHMGNLEGLGGPLGGEKGDYSAPDAYTKFEERCKKDALLGEYIYAEMMKLGIQPSIQSFVGLVPDCSNQVLADGISWSTGERFGDAANWGIINEGGWQGYTRPDVVNPLNIAFDEMSKAWYGALVSIYKPETHGYTKYMGGDLFHEGGNKGSLTDEQLAEVAAKIQKTQNDYFGNGNPDAVTWIIQSWQGSPYQGIRNGLDCKKALIQLLDKDMSTTGGVNANYWNNTTGEHIPWIWVEVLNFGGNTGMHGGARRFRNLAKIGTAANHSASFKGYGILSEGLETNPMMYDMFNDAFTREVGTTSSIDTDAKLTAWIHDYLVRRYGEAYVCQELEDAYQVLIKTVFDCSRYQEGCVENILCAGGSYAVTTVSKWGPKDGIEYDPLLVHEAARKYIEAVTKKPDLKNLDTFKYDFVELFLQILGERGRVINADCATSARKRAEFLGLLDLAERITACSSRWRLDWHEARTTTVCPVKNGQSEGIRGYRRMVTSWADGYAPGQATGLREYAHRGYSGLFKDYYKKRWEWFFQVTDGTLTQAKYVQNLTELDETFPTAVLEPTPEGDMIAIANEILEFLYPPALTWNGADSKCWNYENWTDGGTGATVAWVDGMDATILPEKHLELYTRKSVTTGDLTILDGAVAIATGSGYITTTAAVVPGLNGISLEDLVSKYALKATMNGGYVAEGTASAYLASFNADKTELTVQFQMVDDGFLKVVAVVFAKSGDDITAKALWAKYISGGVIGADASKGSNSSVATTDSESGYGVKAIKLCRGRLTVDTRDGAINVSGTLYLGNNDVIFTDDATISAVLVDSASAKGVLSLGSTGTIKIDNVLVEGGAKLVVSGAAAALTGESGSAKLKFPKSAIGSVVYRGPNGVEQQLKLDANGYAKSKVGVMTYAPQISEKCDLGWTNVTLDDLYNCVFTTEGQTAINLQKGDTAVTFKLGYRSITLTIENGSVHAAAFPAIQGLTATPAVARVISPVVETQGSGGGDTLSYNGEIGKSWVTLGWPTTLTAEDLKNNYTFTSGGVTASNVSIQFDAVYMYFGSSYVMLMNPKGVWKAIVNTGASISGLTATPSQGGVSGVTNFASLGDALSAAGGAEKVVVLEDASVGAVSVYPIKLEVAEDAELKVTVGDFLGWNKAWELHVKGAVDLGGNALSYGEASYAQKIYLYEGGAILNTSGHGFSVFEDSTIYVKRVADREPAVIGATLQARKNITIDVEEGAKALVETNVMDKDGQSGIASPKIVKTGAGALIWNGYFNTQNVALEVRDGTFMRQLEDGETFTLAVAGGTAEIKAANEDYKVVVTEGENNLKTYTAVPKTYLIKVTDAGETGQNGAGKLFETYGEAAEYACLLQALTPSIPVIMWTVVDNRDGLNSDPDFLKALEAYNKTHRPERDLDTITWRSPDGERILDSLWDTEGIYKYPIGTIYYPMGNATEWTSAVRGVTYYPYYQGVEVVLTAKDTVYFNKHFGPIYINTGVLPRSMSVTDDSTLKLGYWNNTSSLPPGMTVQIDDLSTVQFDNWTDGKPVFVPNATVNGEGTFTFGPTITSSSHVEIGTLSGSAALTLKGDVTVIVTGSIDNTLKGTGTIKVMSLPATFNVDPAANVTFVDGAKQSARDIMNKSVNGSVVTLTRGTAVAKVNGQVYGNMDDAIYAAHAGSYPLYVYATAKDIFEDGFVNVGRDERLKEISIGGIILPDARYEVTTRGWYEDGKIEFFVFEVTEGKGCWYDWTLDREPNPLGSKGRTETEVQILCDGNNNYLWNEGHNSLLLKCHPYYGITWNGEFTLATFLSAGTVPDTVLVALGNSHNSLVLIKDEGENMVKLVKIQAGVRSDVSGSILVPNVGLQHLYMITCSEAHDEIKLWIDGSLWETIKLDEPLNLSTGFQIGSIYQGVAAGLKAEAADGPSVKMIRVFTNVLGKACAGMIATQYSYRSDAGVCERTISTPTANWVETDAWAKKEREWTEPEMMAEPEADSTVVLTVACDTVITVNTSKPMTFEAFRITSADEKAHTVTFKFADDTTEEGRANKLMPVLAQIDSGITVITQYAAYETLGAKLRLGENAHLRFSYAGLDPWEVLGLSISGQVSSAIEMGEGSTVEVIKPDLTGLHGIIDFSLAEEGGAYSIAVGRIAHQPLDITWDPAITEWTAGAKGKLTHNGKNYDVLIQDDDIVHFVGANSVNFGDGSAMPQVQFVIEEGAKVTMTGRPNVTAINGTGTVAFTEKELTLDESISGTATMEIAADQTVKATGAISLPVKGTGKIVVSALPSGSKMQESLQTPTWEGTLVLKEIAGVRDLNLASYGNEYSKIELDGVSGFFVNGDLTCTSEVIIGADGLTITDGYSSSTYKFAKVSGSGTISMTKSTVHHKFMIGDVAGFTGSIISSGSPFTVGSLTTQAGTDAQVTVVKNGAYITIPSPVRFAADGIYIQYDSIATAGFDGTIKSDKPNYAVAKKPGTGGATIYALVDASASDPTSWEDVNETTPLDKVVPEEQASKLAAKGVTVDVIKNWVAIGKSYQITIDFNPTVGIDLEAFALGTYPKYKESTKANFKLALRFDKDGKPVPELSSWFVENCNIKPVIKGSKDLKDWHEKADGDSFFKAVIDL